jgi:NAD(P)H-hydrate epimerase
LKTQGGLAFLTAEEMAEADRVAIEDFRVDVLSLMENAGVAVAGVARNMLRGDVAEKGVCCLVGKGNNGGDGLVAARHLHNWGAKVKVVLAGEKSELRDVAAKQFEIVERMGIPVGGVKEDFGGAELLVDALLGYSSRGSPREPIAGLIRRANASKIQTLAVDVPSGLDATTGVPGEPCVVAKATVTLGLPKTGFLNPAAAIFVGELYLADIAMPMEVYLRYSQQQVGFGKAAVVRIL